MKQPVDLIKDKRFKKNFSAYMNAANSDEKSRIVAEYRAWFDGLTAEEQVEATAAMMDSLNHVVAGVRENLDELDGAIIRAKLGEVPQAISLSYIATQCGKSKSWLSQRLNGNKVNGKEARFTQSEAKAFQEALHTLGQKLLSISLL
jgi:DNA-binding phage protein